MVDGQSRLAAGLPRRVQLQLVLGPDVQTEAREPSDVECRHDRSEVPPERIEVPRAHEAGHGEPRIAFLDHLLRVLAVRCDHLRVRPKVRGGEIGKLTGRLRGNMQSRQGRSVGERARVRTLEVDDHEDDPGSEPFADSRRGREEPGQLRPVELDVCEVVRLDAYRTVHGVRAHELARDDSDHVAGAVDNGIVRRLRDAGDGHAHGRRGKRRLSASERVGLRDRRGEPAPDKREEVVGRVGHQTVTSCASTTTTRPSAAAAAANAAVAELNVPCAVADVASVSDDATR